MMRPSNPKIRTAAEIAASLEDISATVVLANGCFDLLHPGHVMALQDAREQGDLLVVLLNSDHSVRALKPGRPLYDQDTRARMLAALACVDYVCIFDGPDCADEIMTIAPHCYAKSEEYQGRQDPHEVRALTTVGARIRWQPRVGDWSTSALVAACARAYLAEEGL